MLSHYDSYEIDEHLLNYEGTVENDYDFVVYILLAYKVGVDKDHYAVVTDPPEKKFLCNSRVVRFVVNDN